MTRDDWDRLFDELYLRTYAQLDRGDDPEAEALGFARLAGLEPGADVLDCPCGYGRHSIPLARAGHRVVGADRSPVLLDEARRRAGEGEWPRWVEADHRELPFADASFGAVFNLFSSLGYRGVDGDRATLSEARRVLRPGGVLVVETMHRDRLARIFQPNQWEPLPDGGALLEARRFNQVEGWVDNDFLGRFDKESLFLLVSSFDGCHVDVFGPIIVLPVSRVYFLVYPLDRSLQCHLIRLVPECGDRFPTMVDLRRLESGALALALALVLFFSPAHATDAFSAAHLRGRMVASGTRLVLEISTMTAPSSDVRSI